MSLTAGFVSWILRGGSLLASLISTVPLLNRFDPLPIVKTRSDSKKSDEKNKDKKSSDDEETTDVDKFLKHIDHEDDKP